MKNLEVLRYLIKESKHIRLEDISSLKELTAISVANHFSVKRNDASHHLNLLVKKGDVIKINTKPVYFISKKILEERFQISFLPSEVQSLEDIQSIAETELLDGISGSIRGELERCVRGMTYPPNGLPVLLCGPTGSGKSFLARKLYEYLMHHDIIAKNAPLNILNCAEYANNKELFTAKLFGYAKGSFTGASAAVEGMIETSEGGILFLDEVHRLHPEDQEKLFILMDKGIYRRMGENKGWRKANLRLIFATTEAANHVLLKTFLRRIPIIANIPSLDQRPQYEKLHFIYQFFQEEAKNMKRTLQLESTIIARLETMHFSGNAGELQNVIRLTCANAYSHQSKAHGNLWIALNDLKGEHPLVENTQTTNIIITPWGRCIDPREQEKLTAYIALETEAVAIFRQLTKGTITSQECVKRLFEGFYKFIYCDYQELKVSKEERHSPMIMRIRRLFTACEIEVTEDIMTFLVAYIEVQQFVRQHHHWKLSGDTKLEAPLAKHFREISPLVTQLTNLLAREFLIHLMAVDKLFITGILSYYNIMGRIKKANGLIIANGALVATSIANYVNDCLKEKSYIPIDINKIASEKQLSDRITAVLKRIDMGKAFVILTDIEVDLVYRMINKLVKCPVVIVDHVSTKLALDLGNALQKRASLDDLILIPRKNYPSSQVFYPILDKKKGIIMTCPTGMGTAVRLRDMMVTSIEDLLEIDVIPCDFERLKDNQENDPLFSQYNIIAVVGTVNPNISDVPYVGIEQIMGKDGAQYIGQVFAPYLSVGMIERLNHNVVRTFSLQRVVDSLTILNPNKIIEVIDEFIRCCGHEMGLLFSNDLIMSLYIHLACMIERMVTKNTITYYTDITSFEKTKGNFIEVIQKSSQVIEKEYALSIPISEIGYIYDIFKMKIKEFQY